MTSQRDAQLLSSVSPSTRAAVVPNGVNVEQFQPSTIDAEPDRLLFFGANNYFPNHDGLLYFIDEILPKVIAQRAQRQAFDSRARRAAGAGRSAKPARRDRRFRR